VISLLDVNVLVALAWPNHVHHEVAHRWFRKARSEGWATCPLTQTGFVRVSSNDRVLPGARSPIEAITLLEKMTRVPGHVFWSDDTSICASRFVSRKRLVGYRQVADAHLLALALRRGGRLATFDRGVLEIVPDSIPADRAACVITAA
jgi:toxin-antitoxin system PIN domain toxin